MWEETLSQNIKYNICGKKRFKMWKKIIVGRNVFAKYKKKYLGKETLSQNIKKIVEKNDFWKYIKNYEKKCFLKIFKKKTFVGRNTVSKCTKNICAKKRFLKTWKYICGMKCCLQILKKKIVGKKRCRKRLKIKTRQSKFFLLSYNS